MKKTIVNIVDDLDGTPGAEKISFGMDGILYTIDLCPDNAEKLRAILQPYVKAGRLKPRGGRPLLSGRSRASLREWARNNGWPNLTKTGRIPEEVYDKFFALRHGAAR